MKVILTEDINPLGAMGSVVDVARGYARNFLIPQGKAMEATPGNLVQIERAKVKFSNCRPLSGRKPRPRWPTWKGPASLSPSG